MRSTTLRFETSFSLLILLGISSCGVSPKLEPEGRLGSYIPYGQAVMTGFAELGRGYDSDRKKFVGQCLTGEMVESGSPESTLYFENGMSFAKLSSQLGVDMRASYQGAVKVKASADFMSGAQSSAYSTSMIYSAIYTGRSLGLVNAKLTDLGRRLVGKPEWATVCGHEYVQQVDRGAQIFVSIKYAFTTKEETERFKLEVGVKYGLGKAESAIKHASEKFAKTGTVTLSAYQMGGDESKISEVFGKQQSGGYSMLECSLDNTKACLAALNNAVHYAAEVFPEQLHSPASGYAVLGYVSQKWENMGISQPSVIVTEGTHEARRRLEAKYFELRAIEDRIKTLFSFQLPSVQRSYLNILRERLSQAQDLLVESIQPCYDALSSRSPTECMTRVDTILNAAPMTQIDANDQQLSVLNGEWVTSNINSPIPANAVVGGFHGSNSRPMWVCRVKVNPGLDESMHVGKLIDDRICRFGYAGQEILSESYQVLISDQVRVKWIPFGTSGTQDGDSVIGGFEGTDKSTIGQSICRVHLQNELHVGKLLIGLCHIGYGGAEKLYSAYDLLIFDL